MSFYKNLKFVLICAPLLEDGFRLLLKTCLFPVSSSVSLRKHLIILHAIFIAFLLQHVFIQRFRGGLDAYQTDSKLCYTSGRYYYWKVSHSIFRSMNLELGLKYGFLLFFSLRSLLRKSFKLGKQTLCWMTVLRMLVQLGCSTLLHKVRSHRVDCMS